MNNFTNEMKTVIVILGVFFIVCSQAKVIFNVYEDECIQELNVDRVAISDAFSRDFFPEDDQNFNNVLTCAWRKEGIIDEEDNLVMDNFRKFLINNFLRAQGSNNLIATLVAADTMHFCEDVRGATIGDTVVKMSNCVLRRLDSYDD